MNTENNSSMETQLCYEMLGNQLAIDSHPCQTSCNTTDSIKYGKKTCMVGTPTSNGNEDEDCIGMVSTEMEVELSTEADQFDHTYSVDEHVDVLLNMSTTCRTADGRVDSFGMNSLLNMLEEIDNTHDALTQFTRAALGGVQVNLLKAPSGGAKGRSGAAIYFVYDASNVIVAVSKIFPQSEELVRELSSLARLRSPEFTHFTIPAPLAAAKIKNINDAAVLVSKVAQGQPISDLIGSLRKPMTVEDKENVLSQLRKALIEMARALAQLHTRPAGSGDLASNSYLSIPIARARHLASVIANTYADHSDVVQLDVHGLQCQLEQLIEECLSDHSVSAIVHGDAHPGNLFWDSSAGITLIDTPSLHCSMDSNGNPIGTPERDIASFEERLVQLCRSVNVDTNEIQSLRDGFLQEYRHCNGAPLSEKKLRLFRMRYVLGDLVLACNKNCSEEIKMAIASLNKYSAEQTSRT